MPTVTFRDDDSPGTRLIRLQEQLRPELEPPAPTIDPAVPINEMAHRLLKSGEAVNRAEAIGISCQRQPEYAEAYHHGLRVPVSTETREHAEPHVARTTSDASVELLRAVQARMAAHGETHAVARKAVMAADPVLARHYHEQTPLPMATPRPRSETAVEEALVSVQKLRRELAQLTPPAERHYRDLSPAEKARQPLRQPRVARLAQGGDKIAAPMLFDGSGGL